MAIPTIGHDFTELWDAEDTGNWSGETLSANLDIYVEGTQSLAMTKVSSETVLAEFDYYTANSSTYLDMSTTKTIFIWFMTPNAAQLGTQAAGGIRITVQDSSSNVGYWYVGGKDTYFGGWTCFTVSSDQALDSGSITNWSQIKEIGVGVYMEVKVSGNVQNVFIDVARVGTGITIKGGTSIDAITIQDIYDATSTTSTAYGILKSQDGAWVAQGKMTFGSTSAGEDCYFEDTDQLIIYKDAMITAGLNEIIIVGNSTGVTSFILGAKTIAGGKNLTSEGCIIKKSGTNTVNEWAIRCSDTNVTEISLYGCLFRGSTVCEFGSSSTAISTTNLEMIGCDFGDCGTIIFNATDADNVIEGNIFANSSDTAAVELYGLHTDGFEGANIFSNTRGIDIKSATTLNIKDVIFANNSSQDVYFDHTTGTATLNAIDTTDSFVISQNVVNWNSYEKTTYNVHMEDSSGDLQSVGVRLANTQGSEIFSVLTDVDGDIVEQSPIRRSRVYTGSLATTVHNPFQLRLRKYDYVPQQVSKTFAAVAVTDSSVMLEDDYASTAYATVAAWSGITINEATTPDRIEVDTTSRTLTQVYEYMRYLTAITTNIDLPDPIQTADGVKFTIADYDFDVDTVSLTGSTLELNMPSKDFTLTSGGSQGLKKLTDTDGTQVSLLLTNVIVGSRCSIYDENSVELMKEIALDSDVAESYVHTTDKNLVIRVRKSYIVQIISISSGGYTNCVDTDIGKSVTDDTNPIGNLIAFDNANYIWYVASDDQILNSSVMDIPTGAGAGTCNADSTFSGKYLPFRSGGEVTADGFSGYISQIEDSIA